MLSAEVVCLIGCGFIASYYSKYISNWLVFDFGIPIDDPNALVPTLCCEPFSLDSDLGV